VQTSLAELQTANTQESETANYTGRICNDIGKSMSDNDVIRIVKSFFPGTRYPLHS
jgi:hypothetical protein